MRIVITGGLGFIGQNLAVYLRRLPGVDLTAIDWLADATRPEKALFDEVHTGCFAEAPALEVCRGADVVVHLAASTTVQDSIRDPLTCFENNVTRTHRLLDFLRRASPDTRVVFASTGGAIIGEYDGPISEDAVPRPMSPYGASKLAGEGLLSAYAGSYGLRSAALRFSNVYGPLSGRKGSVIAAFCKTALDRGEVTIFGDGLQTRDYIHVADICDAIERVIRLDARGVFQLGTGTGTSILDIAAHFRALGTSHPALRGVRLIHADALPGEVRHNCTDITRARTELGFAPKVALRDGIAETLDWFAQGSARLRKTAG